MAISFVGQASVVGTEVTLPVHQPGDLIVIHAYRGTDALSPVVLADGYTSALEYTATQQSVRVAYKFATSSSEVSGNWLNANIVTAHVYRGVAFVGASNGLSGASALNYPALGLSVADGSSWVVSFIGQRARNGAIETAPPFCVNRSVTTTISGTAAKTAGHDSNAGATSWIDRTVATVANTNRYHTVCLELCAKTRISWVPTDITSAQLVGWFDSADTRSFTMDTSNKVSDWRSKASAFKALQVTPANQPTFSATGYNNLPAMLFSGDQFMQATSPASFPSGAEAGVQSGVAPYLSFASDYATIFYQGEGSARAARSISAFNRSVSAGYFGNDMTGNTRWETFDRMFVSMISETGLAQQWVDDGPVQSQQLQPLVTAAGKPFYIARGPGGDYWRNPIQEFCIFKGQLSADDRNKLFGYYAWKWKLVSQLPANHPYKAAAPTVASTAEPLPSLTANLSVTDANDTLTSSSKLWITARAASTDVDDVLVSRANSSIKASANIVEENDTLTSNATIKILATVNVRDDNDQLSSGQIQLRLRARAPALREEDDTLNSYSKIRVTASVSAIDDDDTLVSVIGSGVTASANLIDDDETLEARAFIDLTIHAHLQDSDDTLEAYGTAQQPIPIVTPPTRSLILVDGLARTVSLPKPVGYNISFVVGLSRLAAFSVPLVREIKL